MATISKNTASIPPSFGYLLVHSQLFPLDPSESVYIGRSLENQLILGDPLVSRAHAKLMAVNGHYVICDQNSANGTCVNGQRVNRRVLSSGDVISLASVSMIYLQSSRQLFSNSRNRTRPLIIQIKDQVPVSQPLSR